jgi:hypothetical protein
MTTRNSVRIGDRGSAIGRGSGINLPAEAGSQSVPIPDHGSPIPDETSFRRPIVEHVQPAIDAGRFPIKRTIGEIVVVTADAFADGHDLMAGVLKHRHAAGGDWHEVPLQALGNDSWRASFTVTQLGTHEYTIEAWIDRFGTWLKGLIAKFEAGQDVSSELLEGAELIQAAAGRLKPAPTADHETHVNPYTSVGAGSRPHNNAFCRPERDDP